MRPPMFSIRSPILWILIVVLLCTIAWFMVPKLDDPHDILVSPRKGPFQVSITTIGILQAKNASNIYGPESADDLGIHEFKIVQLVPEGTVVQEGDFVAELDRAELLLKIEETRTELDQAISDFEEVELDTAMTLFKARDQIQRLEGQMEIKKTLLAESVYEPRSTQRKAELELKETQNDYYIEQKSYELELKKAESQIQRAYRKMKEHQDDYNALVALNKSFTVLAPSSGMVIYEKDYWSDQPVMEGSTIGAWDPVIAKLPDFSVMESASFVNEVDIAKVKIGQSVEIGLDAQPGKILPGKVTKIANIGEQTSMMEGSVFRVIIEITVSDSTLRPSLTTSNTILIEHQDYALSLPLECVHVTDSVQFVYVKEGDAVRKKEVITGLMNDNEVIIKGGIGDGEQVYLSIPSLSR